MEIKLDYDNEEQKKAEVKKIQDAIDELVLVTQSQSDQLKKNLVTITEAEKLIKTQQNTIIDMSDAIKNIHLVLQSKRELYQHDDQLKELVNELGKYVVSSGAIKLGVESHKREQNGQA